MNRSRWILLSLGMILALVIVACGASPTVDVAAVQTFTAQTVIAAVTETGVAAGPDLVPTQAPPATSTPQSATETATITPLPTATETPTATPAPLQSPTPDDWRLVEEDNFDQNTFWYTTEADNFSLKYDNDSYLITNGLPSGLIFSVRTLTIQNARLETDAAPVNAAPGSYWGVSCRHDPEKVNYYALVIGPDNFYGIGKMVEGQFSFIQRDTWPDAAVFKPSEAGFVRVRGDCDGDSLSLFVNGTRLLEVKDDTLKTGQIGLVVGQGYSPDQATTVRFDNYKLFRPKE